MPYVVLQTLAENCCLLRHVSWVRMREGVPEWREVTDGAGGQLKACIRTVHVEMEGEFTLIPGKEGEMPRREQKNYLCALTHACVTDDAGEAMGWLWDTFKDFRVPVVTDPEMRPPPPPTLAHLPLAAETGTYLLVR